MFNTFNALKLRAAITIMRKTMMCFVAYLGNQRCADIGHACALQKKEFGSTQNCQG